MSENEEVSYSYPTAQAVDRAIKDAAKRAQLKGSSQSTSELIRSVYHDRLMSRIFSDGGSSRWILKGGNGILARIPNARSTRDIDVVTNSESLNEAIEQLISLSARDLGDFFRFQYSGKVDILEGDKQPNSEGIRLSFKAFLGTKEHSNIVVDVVVSKSIPQVIELEEPASRIKIPKLISHKYRLWPIEHQIADKVAASLTTYSSGESSRSRDLFDLLAISQTQSIHAGKLTNALSSELTGRSLEMKETFEFPRSWWGAISKAFAGSPFLLKFQNDGDVREVLNRLLFPPTHDNSEYFWNPSTQEWSPVRLNLPQD